MRSIFFTWVFLSVLCGCQTSTSQPVEIGKFVEIFNKAKVAPPESRVKYFSRSYLEYSLETILEELDQKDILGEVERISKITNTFDRVDTVQKYSLKKSSDEMELIVDYTSSTDKEIRQLGYVFISTNGKWLIDTIVFY